MDKKNINTTAATESKNDNIILDSHLSPRWIRLQNIPSLKDSYIEEFGEGYIEALEKSYAIRDSIRRYQFNFIVPGYESDDAIEKLKEFIDDFGYDSPEVKILIDRGLLPDQLKQSEEFNNEPLSDFETAEAQSNLSLRERIEKGLLPDPKKLNVEYSNSGNDDNS